eukprot:gene12647-13946_t
MSSEFRFPDLISSKRDGKKLSKEEITHFINGLVNGEVHSTQTGAMLMAIFLKGMDRDETINLTHAMLHSGEVLTWPTEWQDVIVDKHSTGGVGDKISLPLAPALAACGMKVPMISGRSLGFTGGTLDKLESIPGFNTGLERSEVMKVLDLVGCCIIGQSESFVPADKIMYSARDVTATVACLPLVCSSIISKKAAEGLKALILDVKVGNGSFTKTRESAQSLAEAMVATSNGLGIKTTAIITEMDNPIGKSVGNSIEVAEAIDCMNGRGPHDLRELVCEEGGELLWLANKASSAKQGCDLIRESLDNGCALNKFKEMIKMQGVSSEIADELCCKDKTNHFSILPLSNNKTDLKIGLNGVVASINSLCCAEVSSAMGAGRTIPGEKVSHDVGLKLHVSVGDCVAAGDVWATVYHKHPQLESKHEEKLQSAIVIDSSVNSPIARKTRIVDIIR